METTDLWNAVVEYVFERVVRRWQEKQIVFKFEDQAAQCVPDGTSTCIPVIKPPCYISFGASFIVPPGGSVDDQGAGACKNAPPNGWLVMWPPILNSCPDDKPKLSGCGHSETYDLSVFATPCAAPAPVVLCSVRIIVGCTDCLGDAGNA